MVAENQEGLLNHCRILKLRTRGDAILHKIFRERWEYYCKLNSKINKWNDDEASGKQLLLICGTVLPNIKDSFQTGNVDLWDITATNLAIQAVSKEIRKHGGKTDKNEDTMINSLREVRNQMAHGKSELSEDEFLKDWDELEKILVNLGDDVNEINKLKEGMKKLGHEKVVEIYTNDATAEFNKQKTEANKLFKDEKYNEAIKVYDKVLQLPQLLPENQALIFSNRSVAYLKLKDEKHLKMAKRDAEWAVQLWPCWWKGYYRLGQAQAKLGELPDAMKSLETALALNPKSTELFDELSAVRREHGIISREEYFNPAQQTKSHDFVKKEVSERMGISIKEVEKMMKLMQTAPSNQFTDIFKAHQFRDGEGVPQDYTKAAAYYAKAAHAGNPEGMYNLALLHESGKGVKRDFNESLRWLLKAANSKAFLMQGSGVPEAQHTLGLKYTEGVGVEQNYKIAAEWYEKAVSNGFAGSANNLGILYKKGQGVERSLEKAFQYFKISAQRGDTAGMGNLAHCYFYAQGTGSVAPTKEDNAEGVRWLRIAAGKGDLVAARELERREKLTEDEAIIESIAIFFASLEGSGPKSNPLDEKQFGKEVRKAAQNGSIMAKRQIEIWKNLNIAMEAFKNNDPARLICALSKAIRLDHQIVEVPNVLHSIINKRIETHSNDIDAITCFIRINTKNGYMPEYVFKYLEIFPRDEYLIEMCAASFIRQEDYKGAKMVTTKALKMFPQSLRFIYIHAIVLCKQKTVECIKALDEFLALAPKDHDKVPACHYRKATYYFKKQRANFFTSFKAGLEAEKHQLPCFLPYQFPLKDMMMKIYMAGKLPEDMNTSSSSIPAGTSSTINRLELVQSNPLRKILITKNREALIFVCEKNSFILNTVPKPLNTPKPPKLTSLKPITLKDIDPTVDKVYDGYVLEATIIDWPFIMKSVTTVIQDENGDLQRMSVYNWPTKNDRQKDLAEAIKTFRPNVTISIINPYMRMSNDGQNIIRVENPVYIRLDDTSADQKCTFCGKEAKVLPCSGCKMSRYCSKECQKIDWNEFNHKGICKHLKYYSSL